MSLIFFLSWFPSKLLLALCALILAICYIIPVVIKRRRFVRLIDQLPGEKTLPIFGNALEIVFTPINRLTGVIRKKLTYFPTEPIIRIWIFNKPIVFIMKAEAAEVILSNPRCVRKSDSYRVLHPWLGLGLLTSDNPKWKIHRRLLTPSFHFKILEEFNPIFNEQSEVLLSTFEKYKNREPFDMYRHITLCTLDIICEAAMGKHLKAQTNSDTQYVKSIENYKKLFLEMFIKPWLQIPWIRNLMPFSRKLNACIKPMHAFTNQVIKEKKQQFKANKNMNNATNDNQYVFGQKKRLAFLDTLLEALDKGEAQLTDEEIREEVDTFMFEGHDTTAAAITITLFILGWHEHIQDKIFEELDQVLGSEKHVTIDHMSRLKYLDAVIKEALRLVPSVPTFGRQLTEDVQICGYTIPAGTEVNFSPYNIHRDYDVYLNPSEFVPERFLSESWQKHHPYAYIPFSAGSRNCIGQKFAQMEEKVILSQILRRYKILPYQVLEDGAIAATLVITPTDGLKMALEKR